ncbi:MAG: phosphatase PAP2 family protein [Sulfolobales archaeon]
MVIAISITIAIAVAIAVVSTPPISIGIWYGITSLGDETIYVGLSIIIYYMVSPWVGFATAIAVLLGGVLVIDLKEIFMLPRPPNPVFPEEGYGFPSGHAQVSSAFWVSLALIMRSVSIVILAAVMITSISLSRLALNAHYPRDVLGGIAIGSAVGAIASLIPRISTSKYKYIYLASPLAFLLAIISYYIYKDATLLKIAGISLGLSIHAYIYRSQDLQLRWHIIDRAILTAILGLISISILYLTRGAPPYIIFIGYTAIGVAIPLAGYIASRIRDRARGPSS